MFFEICTFASYVFVSKNRVKGHGISLFLVMESHEKSWNLKSQKEYEPCSGVKPMRINLTCAYNTNNHPTKTLVIMTMCDKQSALQ